MQLICCPAPTRTRVPWTKIRCCCHWTTGHYKNVTFQLFTRPGMNNPYVSEIMVNYSSIWLLTEASFAYRSSFYYVQVFRILVSQILRLKSLYKTRRKILSQRSDSNWRCIIPHYKGGGVDHCPTSANFRFCFIQLKKIWKKKS